MSRLFEIWRGAPPPEDFADRVLGAERRAAAARRRARGALLCAAVAAVLFAAWLQRPRSLAVAGGRSATGLEELALGERATVVAEPGAVLAWRGGADTVVAHAAGAAFYRVDSGGRFAVETPAGTIEVTGTCFRVEVHPMKRELFVGGASAAIAIAATVIVYEGSVRARSEGGEASAGPGERIALRPGLAPSRSLEPAPASASRAELAARDRVQIRTIRELETRIRELETRLAEAETGPAGAGDEAAVPGDKFFDLTDEELRLLAERCELRYDVPGYALSVDLGPHLERVFESADIAAAEAELIRAAMDKGDPQLLAELRAIYIEVTGDRAGADSLSPRNLQHEVFDKSSPADLREAQRRLSAERAGLLEPPADPSSRPPVERMLRALAVSGEVLEGRLAADLGAERARELRENAALWGRRRQSGCP